MLQSLTCSGVLHECEQMEEVDSWVIFLEISMFANDNNWNYVKILWRFSDVSCDQRQK